MLSPTCFFFLSLEMVPPKRTNLRKLDIQFRHVISPSLNLFPSHVRVICVWVVFLALSIPSGLSCDVLLCSVLYYDRRHGGSCLGRPSNLALFRVRTALHASSTPYALG